MGLRLKKTLTKEELSILLDNALNENFKPTYQQAKEAFNEVEKVHNEYSRRISGLLQNYESLCTHYHLID